MRAVGTPAASIASFAKALEPSRRAAAAPGPNATTPAALRRSTSPSVNGSSGPTTTRSTRSRVAAATRPSTSSTATSSRRASSAIPGFPGAQRISDCRGRAGQRAHDRVLAPARADDQHRGGGGRRSTDRRSTPHPGGCAITFAPWRRASGTPAATTRSRHPSRNGAPAVVERLELRGDETVIDAGAGTGPRHGDAARASPAGSRDRRRRLPRRWSSARASACPPIARPCCAPTS